MKTQKNEKQYNLSQKLVLCMVVALVALLSFCRTSVAVVVSDLTIGPGDVYQQPSTSPWELKSFELLEGGSIIERADGRKTWFLSNSHRISGGTIDATLRLDLSENPSGISGGVFNKPLFIDRSYGFSISGGAFYDAVEIDRSYGFSISGGTFYSSVEIDRLSDGALLDISGGLFEEHVYIKRHQGAVSIRGGEFNNGISTASSFTDGALPTLTITGTEWEFNGHPLVFLGTERDLTGRTGLLTGTLQDGNAFSFFITDHPHKITIANIPEPSSLSLLCLGALGLLGFGRRRK